MIRLFCIRQLTLSRRQDVSDVIFFSSTESDKTSETSSPKSFRKKLTKKKKKQRPTWQRRLLSVMSIGGTTPPGCGSWATAHSTRTVHVHTQVTLTRQKFFCFIFFLRYISFFLLTFIYHSNGNCLKLKKKMFRLCNTSRFLAIARKLRIFFFFFFFPTIKIVHLAFICHQPELSSVKT